MYFDVCGSASGSLILTEAVFACWAFDDFGVTFNGSACLICVCGTSFAYFLDKPYLHLIKLQLKHQQSLSFSPQGIV